jgi:hypothetical protein
MPLRDRTDAPTEQMSLCIKFLKQILFWVLVFLVLFLATVHIHASDYFGNPLSQNNVAYKPVIETAPEIKLPSRPVIPARLSNFSHSILAATAISPEALRQYLESKGSPLAGYVELLQASPYWSTIIGICTIEEYSCTHFPENNMGGLMSRGHLIPFNTLADWISAENAFLEKAYAEGKTTIESLNGWYVVPASNEWLNTVIQTKQTLENL